MDKRKSFFPFAMYDCNSKNSVTDPFTIFYLLPEDARRIEASVNEPHLHDYEELLLGMEGQPEHFIDFKSTVFQAPYVSFMIHFC